MADKIDRYVQYLVDNGGDPEKAKRYGEYLRQNQAATQGQQQQLDAAVSMDDRGKTVKTGLGAVGKAVDYLGGMTRVGLAKMIDPVMGTNAVDSKMVDQALHGEAPPLSEILRRQGVPEMGKLKIPIPGTGYVTGRGTIGMMGEVATDPLNVLLEGAGKKLATSTNPIARAGEYAFRPVGAAAEDIGENMYKSGFKNIDVRLKQEGVKPLSEVLWENGRPTGTGGQIRGQVLDLKDRLMNERAGLYNEANATGTRISPVEPTNQARARIETYKDNPYYDQTKLGKLQEFAGLGLRPDPAALRQAEIDYAKKLMAHQEAQKTRSFADKNLRAMNGESSATSPLALQAPKMPELPPKQYLFGEASNVKTGLRNKLPDAAFGPSGYITDEGQDLVKTLGNAWQREIELAGNRAKPGLGDKIKTKNEAIGSIIEAEEPLKMEERKGVRVNGASSIDMGLAGHIIADPTAAPMLGLKKVGDLGKTMWFRTKGGKLINAAGASGRLDPMIRRMYIDSQLEQNQPESPWMIMDPANGDGR